MRRLAALAPLAAGLIALATQAQAACRLALVVALDISSSVNAEEDRLQRAGLAAALTAPEVQQEILSVPGAPVALAVYEWSGRYQQDMVLDWRLLDSPAAIAGAAADIANSRRRYAEFPTAMGFGIGYAAGVFQRAPPCLFQTLDISGDGINNDGFGPDLAYRNFPLAGITVNGLAIGGATEDDAQVFRFYREQVIRGPGAFVETARDFTDFERAMRRKLTREMAARVYGGLARPPREREG
ncbi:DUF1194 domain-containing protein [Rhodovulum adriaticum]|uniref:Uncharacterized protein DUF1194 n=1 Tax=Rhodovulum adriaticum TaxID=35804 RepID=A0A4R2NLG1_RHOAD|nr:DUF1194 domain-containing protein [Rhodovulum adriaticum]MBK1636017.1 hypothetical protein [Rhodovulum adriaticum]TCP22449.1 uncharacterized protein DUF1194 [Rhodovulum adriaticum]